MAQQKVDLSAMSYSQIAELVKSAGAILDARRSEELAKVCADFSKSLVDSSFEMADALAILRSEKGATRVKTSKKRTGLKVPVKYRNGADVWTGRGKQPNWLKKYMLEGGTLEQVLVN